MFAVECPEFRTAFLAQTWEDDGRWDEGAEFNSQGTWALKVTVYCYNHCRNNQYSDCLASLRKLGGTAGRRRGLEQFYTEQSCLALGHDSSPLPRAISGNQIPRNGSESLKLSCFVLLDR